MTTATVTRLPSPVTRCQFCGAALSSRVTLTITAAGAHCTDSIACAGRQGSADTPSGDL
jgi:hypothetical protein